MNSEIYNTPVADNLKPMQEMSEKDNDELNLRLKLIFWVCNRTFVTLDEETMNRLAVCTCASMGFEGPIAFNHHYILSREGDA